VRSHTRRVTLPMEPPAVPDDFRTAVEAIRAGLGDSGRPGLELREEPAPRRLAPHAVAVAAQVLRGDEEIASGRFVVLHDPTSPEGWRGDTRVVAFVQAEVDAEMAADASLGEVGWSWLTESLEQRGADYTAAGGTVTRTVSARFGQLSEPEEDCEVEVRASWTPLRTDGGALELVRHLGAWCDLLCATAGLPPPGVLALSGH
jgi:hypothetical protein